MRGLNPRQIEAFRALILTGGVGAAANLLNISQPAVSRMIRDFQQDLGLSLFERRGTRLVPTSDALSLYAEVERAFVGLDRIAKTATELRTRRAGFLRIAALPALANGFLPRFAGQFAAERPKLDLGVSGLVSHAVVAAVAQGQSDLGFAESSLEHAAVQTERMPAAPYVAVLPRGHRLARKKRLHPADFAGESFVSLGHSSLVALPDRPGVRRAWRRAHPAHRDAAVGDRLLARRVRRRGLALRALHRLRIHARAASWSGRSSRTSSSSMPRSIRPPSAHPSLARQFIDGFRAHVADLPATGALARGIMSRRSA